MNPETPITQEQEKETLLWVLYRRISKLTGEILEEYYQSFPLQQWQEDWEAQRSAEERRWFLNREAEQQREERNEHRDSTA